MNDFIEINSDGFMPIKATPKPMMPLMKRQIQQKSDQFNARQEHKKTQPDDEAKKFRAQARPANRLPNGMIVAGNLSDTEKKALTSDNDALLRRQAMLRQKAVEIMKQRHLEGKSRRDYYQSLRSYEHLSKQQGQLPNSPYHDRDRFLEER